MRHTCTLLFKEVVTGTCETLHKQTVQKLVQHARFILSCALMVWLMVINGHPKLV